jgi:hypothetical protein
LEFSDSTSETLRKKNYNRKYITLLSETAFQNDFGPKEVPETRKPVLSLSD